MKKIAIALTTLLLTGCAGLELVHLAGQVIAQEASTVAVANDDVRMQENAKVYVVNMRQRRPYGFAFCQYKGVMVEYARDWNELDEQGNVVRVAEPDKAAGYALLLNQETCPKGGQKAILKVGSRAHYPWGAFVIRKSHSMIAVNYYGLSTDIRPKWMPQVLATLRAESATNPDAARFLAGLEARQDPDLPL
jgi:hypothetical protein